MSVWSSVQGMNWYFPVQRVDPLATVLAAFSTAVYFTMRHQQQLILKQKTQRPFAGVGGLLALWGREMPFSISAGVGFKRHAQALQVFIKIHALLRG